jgi:hypothetical protein
MRKATLLLCLILLASCVGKVKTNINNSMASWVDHHFTDLLASWGPPQQVMDDGNGGRVFVYTKTRSYTAPSTATTTANATVNPYNNTIWGTATTTYNPGQTYSWTSYRMFFIGSNGRIYRWAWRGL